MDRLNTFNVKHFKKLLLVLALVTFGFTSHAQGNGEKLFKANCASCHSQKTDQLGPVAPGLKGALGRWGGDYAKIAKWVANPTAYLAATGDGRLKGLVDNYKGVMMSGQAVNAAEVKEIIDYVEAYVDPKGGDVAKDGKTTEAPVEVKKSNPLYLWLGIGAFFAILIAILAPVRRNLQNSAKAKAGKAIEDADLTFWEETKAWVYSHKKIVMMLGFVVFIMLFLVGWYALKGIGVYDGYQPTQPIKFSHKIHAGDNKINCQYCHTGVEKSKHANIPSVNVCLNCHKYIQEGPVNGKTEIAKIYAALDYNPQTATFGPNPKPIQWVRVHNLPDHAYFNHSQHVKVGKQECQTCHGPIQEMDEVKQFAPLTMGWCIDCHRNTEVKADSNAYYTDLKTKFTALHPGEKFTVEKIGGLECSKCHY